MDRPSHRAQITQRLLWASVILSLITLGLSMVLLGEGSLFISPSTCAVTLIYVITLLALSAKERRKQPPPQQEFRHALQAQRHSTVSIDSEKTFDVDQGSIIAVLPNYKPTSQQSLPHVCRLPSIVFAFLFSLLLLVSLGVLCWLTASWDNHFEGPARGPKVVASIMEGVFVAGHTGVMAAFAILCTKERKVLAKVREGKQPEV